MIRPAPAVVSVVAAVLAGAWGAAPCATGLAPGEQESPRVVPLAQLWVDPGRTPRDLFWGVGGRRYAPDPDAVYELQERDESGFSVSYDVADPRGTAWSAKIGPEAQTEVVVSRILWGLGYHQPPIYYLPSWTLDDGTGKHREESEARFRPKLDRLQRLDEYWRWSDSPFRDRREFRGLLVVLLMLNSTDLKDDNNSIYELKEPWDGARRWFVVRDVGAALGETGKLYPRRNWIEGFEAAGFITGVDGDRVEFDYHGRHAELLEMITAADVRWAAARMDRLSERQLRDAFRAANYADPVANRYLRRLKEKIHDGLALKARPAPDDRATRPARERR